MYVYLLMLQFGKFIGDFCQAERIVLFIRECNRRAREGIEK
jgi:hypothetical protein